MQHERYFGDYAIGVSAHWYDVPQTIFSFAVMNESSGLLFEFGIFGATLRVVVCVVKA